MSSPRASAAIDPLARVLLPTLVHRLNNTTQLLASLQALVAIPDADELLERRSGDLADAAREIAEAGWCLAVVASAAGHDLLLARRRADGLALMAEHVRHAVRRDGRELPPPRTPLPRLRSEPPQEGAWRLPWALGLALWCTASAELAWELERGTEEDALRLAPAPPEPLAAHAALLVARLGGARLAQEDEGWRLAWPVGWLAAESGAP